MKLKTITKCLGAAAFLFISSVMFSGSAHAAYSNNNLISDMVFDNVNSMSEQQIRDFINSRPDSCLAKSGAIFPEPITYWQYGGNVDAARVIYNSSRYNDINPQVILSTLQKEQSLITRTDCYERPSGIDSRNKALGMGCPDGGQCPAPAYAGFHQQIMKGSWQFAFDRHRAVGDTGWGDNGSITYKGRMTEGDRTACAGCPMIHYDGWYQIDNQWTHMDTGATASMYNYTPHLNQSFPVWFEKWFGSVSGSPLAQISGDPTIYLIWSGKYYAIPSFEIMDAYGLSNKSVMQISSSYLSGYSAGPPLARVAIFSGDGAYYMVDMGRKLSFPSPAVLSSYGYTMTSGTTYDSSLANAVPYGGEVKTVARDGGSGAIHLMENGKKRVFPDADSYAFYGYMSSPYTNYSTSYMNSLPDGAPMMRDGRYVKDSSSSAIYLYDQSKLWLFTPDSYVAWGQKADYWLNAAQIAQLQKGTIIPTLLKSSAGQKYIADLGVKKQFSADVQSKWGLADNKFSLISDASLSRLSNGAAKTLIQPPGTTVYKVEGGASHPFVTAQDFNRMGYSWDNVDRVGASAMQPLQVGPTAFATGRLIRTPNGAVSVVDDNYSSFTVPSLDAFYNFGFDWNAVLNLDANALNGYTQQVSANLVRDSAGAYFLMDSAQKHPISSSMFTAYNFSARPSNIWSSALINQINSGGALTQYIKSSGPAVYMVQNGQKRPFNTQAGFFASGGSWDKVMSVSASFGSSLPTGASMD